MVKKMAYEFRFPDVGEGIAEGELKKWLVKEGEEVKQDQALCEVETDKAVVELPSPIAGAILKLMAKEGEQIKVHSVLAVIGAKGEKIELKPTTEIAKVKIEQVEIAERKIEAKQITEEKKEKEVIGTLVPIATPSTRKLAREMGVELSRVIATGANGKITDEDVKRAGSGKGMELTKTGEEKKVEAKEKFDFEKEGSVKRIPIKGIRKIVGEKMKKAFDTIPFAVHMEEIDATELVKVREKEKIAAEKQGIKLTYLPFIIKAVCLALKKHQFFNASIDENSQEIVLKEYYNIGIAVDTEEGLMVVVVKNSDKKSILELAKELQELGKKARERKVSLEELHGHTFTITNIGSFGGIFSVPIINYPDCAILGVHRIKKRVEVIDGKIELRDMLNVSLPFDHRIADGADAGEFVNAIKEQLENPNSLLIGAE